ncbi:hypothetical protein MKEN_00571500 [Mycena kentingensis (nom. inval.)]|nr:hypothetical protein MKEN_00571500 [Mycena kentingensis (nom. inval.)]
MYLPPSSLAVHLQLQQVDWSAAGEWLRTIGRVILEWLRKAWLAVVDWLRSAGGAVCAWLREGIPVAWDWVKTNGVILLEPLNNHPKTSLLVSATIFLGPQIVLLPILLLQLVLLGVLLLLGFGTRGIVAGSPAAGYQSLFYGGNTPAGSTFAVFQSFGMKYNAVTLSSWVLALVRLFAGGVRFFSLSGYPPIVDPNVLSCSRSRTPCTLQYISYSDAAPDPLVFHEENTMHACCQGTVGP